jgi:hypothetical protein
MNEEKIRNVMKVKNKRKKVIIKQENYKEDERHKKKGNSTRRADKTSWK